mmetsp:Transcript_34981/g.55960  ORF Transcript_34981/g.55960 Transcript_34981/m.55960 type:complete len:692 (-) Transcript_34981:784-2859(-)
MVSKDESTDELNMIRSLLRAESTRDESQIKDAQTQLLSSLNPTAQSVGASSADEFKGGDTSKRKAKKKSATPVSRLLRHHKQRNPVICDESTSVKDVASMLCAKRQSAALVLRKSPDGKESLCGICSEVDICRRLVGQNLKADDTAVKDIMTKDPCCVDPDEDFSIVLQMMVKHRFRHLPVVMESFADDVPSGKHSSSKRFRAGICGLVDITQCLYDAIHKIERLQVNQSEFFQAVQRAQYSTSGELNPIESEELAQRTLKALMDSISPKVGQVVQTKSLLKLDVDSSVLDAALAMKEARMTAVLVFEGLGNTTLPYSHKALSLEKHQKFVGILTCKDVMARVIAKGLDPNNTKVGDCMTGNPDTVRKDSSVLDALHIMQTEKYLHLPVIDGTQHNGVGDETDGDRSKKDQQANGGTNGEADEALVCGILSVLDCAVHTFASSSGTAAQVLSTAPSHQPLYPTPVHGGDVSSRSISDSVPSAPLYSHQQWRDPDSISAFSEVRTRKSCEDSSLQIDEELELPPAVDDHPLEADLGYNHSRQSVSAFSGGKNATPSLVIKVKDTATGKVYRLSDASVRTMDDLLNELERVTGKDYDDFQLVYLDEDKDHVQLANDRALNEARNLAHNQKWKKIDVFILGKDENITKQRTGQRTSLDDPILIAAVCVVAVAVIAVFSISIFASQQSTNYRRYR